MAVYCFVTLGFELDGTILVGAVLKLTLGNYDRIMLFLANSC